MSRSIVDLTPAEIDKLAREAWSDAARQALGRGLPVSGSRDGRRFRYHPDRRLEDLGPVGGTPAIEPTLAMPNIDSPKLHFQGEELPEAYREMAEVRLSQATDVYQRAKAEVEATTDLVELTKRIGKDASAYQRKLLDIARTNTNAIFDLAEKLAGAKSQAEALEMWVANCRELAETYAAQTKELAELTGHFAKREPSYLGTKIDDKDSSVA